MTYDVIVIGAGIVGVSTAIHLVKRGRSVLLIDKREPGRETSYGNAGIIQREGVRPHPFPRDLAMLAQVGLGRSTQARYQPTALPYFAPKLLKYWFSSSPKKYDAVVRNYAPLIARSLIDHDELVQASGAQDLIIKNGWYLFFRKDHDLREEAAKAQQDHDLYGINSRVVDGIEFSKIEPDVTSKIAGAIHWQDPWTVKSPSALVDKYYAYYKSLGGEFISGEVKSLEQENTNWVAKLDSGALTGREAVITLGPWAAEMLQPLGYNLPLFVKRGYHIHYTAQSGKKLNNTILDGDAGYVLAPMERGIRLTTGAEFDLRDAKPTPIQLNKDEAIARALFPLDARVEDKPWMGARPCTPDMMPIIGAAPNHRGLWAGIGHAHHGFTLGPATGRLLAQAMTGEEPSINIKPFAMSRFLK